MGERILAGIAANVLSSLGSYAIQEIGLAWGFKKDLSKMESLVSTIKNVLSDAQEQSISNRAVKEWLERLELILYDVYDLLDEVAAETKTRQVETRTSLARKVHYFCTSSNPVVFRYVVGRKIKDIRERLNETVLQMNNFQFVVKLVERQIETIRREETSSFVNAQTTIGREDDREKLVRLLLSSHDAEDVAIILIVGIGGLGKTTLAQLVYNDRRIQNHFTKGLWVCVSNDFDIKTILIKLLQADGRQHVSITSYRNEGLEQLQNQVRNILSGDNFLLFLDDVWNEDRVEWKKLEDLFMTLGRGVRIVVTTRSKMVASIVRTSTVEPYELEGLSDNDCLDILVKWAFKEGDENKHQNLVNIGMNEELEDIGENYLQELVRRCFLIPYHASTYYDPSGRERYIMHDLVHDLAQYVAGNEFLCIKGLITEAVPDTVRHVSFESNAYCEFPRLLIKTKKLRSIFYPSKSEPMSESSVQQDITSFRRLRVLEGCRSLDNIFLPKKRGKLKLLRYLSLNGVQSLPKSLSELLYLQYLDLSESQVFELPEDFGKLIDLRFLCLSTTLTCLPKNEIGRLTSLRTLIIYRCMNLTSLGEAMEHLSCLRELVVDCCDELVSLPADYRHLTSLDRLEISFCRRLNFSDDADLEGLLSLKKLVLNGLPGLVSLPKGLQEAAATLNQLEIVSCWNFTSPSESVLPNLISLQSLRVCHCRKVRSLPEGMQSLTKLHYLNIFMCYPDTSRYREGGEDWPKIAHVPTIDIF
ncbi:hypothetical protein Vadar_021048 [Vaccinium darrowii]|uniref:Uncharacterized protein n=1 Tax=Vaccinium darrowii TaxID=229202 RepID=A0ACB7YNU6_9ERIC|nr:hypothetical protein Vadar_021048 [Vaccinium darrowii]